MKLVSLLSIVCFSVNCSIALAQEITPEPPATTPNQPDNITIELAYFGISKPLSDEVTAQFYGAYGVDDELGLAIFDLSTNVDKNVQIGGRYVYFGAENSSDQHSLWGYVNLEKRFGSSWRIDTRQVIEQRFDTKDVEARTRYRPRFRVSYFGQTPNRDYQLYASVEPIFNLTDDNDDQTSWAAGGYLEINENTQLNAFYQFTKTDRGPDIHFPGIGLIFSY